MAQRGHYCLQLELLPRGLRFSPLKLIHTKLRSGSQYFLKNERRASACDPQIFLHVEIIGELKSTNVHTALFIIEIRTSGNKGQALVSFKNSNMQ